MTETPVPLSHPDDTADSVAFFARYGDLFRNPLTGRIDLDSGERLTVEALISGIDAEHRLRLTRHFEHVVEESARKLLAEPDLRDRLDKLPFQGHDTVVALGDSITDDTCSWAQILQQVLLQHGSSVKVVNAGVSGDTTGNALTRLDLLARHQPEWVIQLLGTNDARRHGRISQVRAVSAAETERNLRVLAELVETQLGAKLIRMVPPPVVGDLAEKWPFFNDLEITWRSADIDELARHMVTLPGLHIDLKTGLAAQPGTWLLPDGVHPTVAGHEQIVRTLIAGLTART